MIAEATVDLRYVDPQHTAVDGRVCGGLIVRTASRVIGQLQGFLIDRVSQQLRYLVVGTSEVNKTRLMPVAGARIDLEGGAIELPDSDEAQIEEAFRPELFKPIAEDRLGRL